MKEDVVNMKETKNKETKIDENKNEEIKEVKLEDLFDIRVGVMLNRMPCNNDVEVCNIRVLSATYNCDNKCIDKSYAEHLRETHKILEEGDFIVSLVYPYHVAYITKELAGCITSQFHVVLRPKNKEKMNVDYYHGVLYRLSVNGKMAACKNTNAARTSIIKLSEFKALTVPATDEEEQRAGAKIFIQFQERIKLLQELIEMEKELIGAEKKIFDGINRTEVHASELINLHKKWKKESVVKVKKISSSWDDFLCDVINSTR